MEDLARRRRRRHQTEFELEIRRRVYSVDTDSFLFNGWTNLVLYLFMIFLVFIIFLLYFVPNEEVGHIRYQLIPEVEAKIEDVTKDISIQEDILNAELEDLTAEYTGIKPSVVSSDRLFLIDYLKPVLSWKNGNEYDEGRQLLISKLGGSAREVTEFMTENDRVDDYNFVDWRNIESQLSTFSIYPIRYKQNGQEVTYYASGVYHITDRDMTNIKPVDNYILMQITLTGDIGDRQVEKIQLGQGFKPDYVVGLGEEGEDGFELSKEYQGLTPEEILDKAFSNYIDESLKNE